MKIGVSLVLIVAGTVIGRQVLLSSGSDDTRKSLPPAIVAQPGAGAGMNVVLVTLDTTRADRIGCYGCDWAATPVIDELAKGGVRIADAVTCVPMTLPSHATILTGKYPPNTGVRDNGLYRLDDRHDTLAERLHAKGYATAAFIAAFVLDHRYGLNQGFEHYDDDITLRHRQAGVRQAMPQRPANAVVDSALAWLTTHEARKPDQPFFMWVHLFDPHTPYAPPSPYNTRFAQSAYDGEIAFMDQQIGRLIAQLNSLGLGGRTLVVLIGDHGEGLGEHHEKQHSLLVYDSTMHVPFIMYAPGVIPAGRVIADRVVATVDVVPTILDLLGEKSHQPVDGVSLLRRATRDDRAVYLETLSPRLDHGWSELCGFRTHVAKYIRAPTPEYYDLVADPGENHNLLAGATRQDSHHRERLAKLIARFPADGLVGSTIKPDQAAIRKLQALGYAGGGEDLDEDDETPRPDPKEMVRRWETDVRTVVRLVDRGRFAEAVPHLQKLLKAMPQDARLWNLLSIAQMSLGDLNSALASRMKTIDLQPGDANHWIQLAHLQRKLGDLEAVESTLAHAAEIEPDHGEIYLLRAQIRADAGEYEQALALCAEARRRDPTRHMATSWSVQASIYERTNEPSKAKDAYSRAHQYDPADSGALLGLARIALRERQPARVIEFAAKILRGEGQWPESRLLLARAFLQQGRGDEAIAAMQSLVEDAPGDARSFSNLGNVHYLLGHYQDAVEAYRRAVNLDPDYAKGHYNLGNALKQLGELDKAARCFNRALELDPDLHLARMALARDEARRGRIEDALVHLKKLLATHNISVAEIESDADFDALCRDPRFEKLKREQGE